MKHTKENKIEALKNDLSSAFQELAIDNARDYFNECQKRGEEIPSQQEFMDYACEQYRDILKGREIRDIYEGFRKYGDETELDFIAGKVWQVLVLGMTSKDHQNIIVKKAWQINTKLNKIRQECEALIEQCQEHGDNWDGADYEYSLAYLVETLEDLKGFDLEDAIPERASVEY
jgi:hypothetical protein